VLRDVRIIGISLLGSGCPESFADVQASTSKTVFEATFSQFQVESGPKTLPASWRRNCKLIINMEFTSGFQ
jgi:hypothetical protein